MSVTEILKKHATDYGLEINEKTADMLEIYVKELREWNEKINLTAITDDEGIALKHFLDCLLCGTVVPFEDGKSIIDVGTGAGFPGLVLAAAYPNVNVTLLDSTGKKLKAVEAIAEAMGVKNVKIVHARAEEAGKKTEFRERYDFATARAVAELRVLSEYALPFVKKGGFFISLKGATAKEEIAGSANALNVLGGKTDSLNELVLPAGDKRAIIKIKKISQTSPKYPRPSAQIAKKPL